MSRNVLEGSPEWFKKKSETKEMIKYADYMSGLRESFKKDFSPEKLKKLTPEELLDKVFGNSAYSMLNILNENEQYRWFGAGDSFKYDWILYVLNGTKDTKNSWNYKQGTRTRRVSYEEALEKAELIRDELVETAEIIESSDLTNLSDYINLEKKLSHIFFYKYVWVLKYYQMLYPYKFPSMYGDSTLKKAIKILGLRSHSKRLVNVGEIAVFMNKCRIRADLFSKIYGDRWEWDVDYGPCEAAELNYIDCI